MEEREFLQNLETALARGEEGHAAEVLAFLAGSEVALDGDAVRGATRRAVQLLAAGGDPMRGLDVDGRAVRALADDLDRPDRRAQLEQSLHRLRMQANGLPLVTSRLQTLEQDSDRAWRWFACALLADELGEE